MIQLYLWTHDSKLALYVANEAFYPPKPLLDFHLNSQESCYYYVVICTAILLKVDAQNYVILARIVCMIRCGVFTSHICM